MDNNNNNNNNNCHHSHHHNYDDDDDHHQPLGEGNGTAAPAPLFPPQPTPLLPAPASPEPPATASPVVSISIIPTTTTTTTNSSTSTSSSSSSTASSSSPTTSSPPSGERRAPLWGSASAARLVEKGVRAQKHRSLGERYRVSKQVSVAQRSRTSHQADHSRAEGVHSPQRTRDGPLLLGFMRSRQTLAPTAAAAAAAVVGADVSICGVNAEAGDGGVGGEEEEVEEEKANMARRSRGGTICMTSGRLPAFLSNLLDAPTTRDEASALSDNDDDDDDEDDEETDSTINTGDGDDDDGESSSEEDEEEEEMESGELTAVEEEEEEAEEEEEEEDNDFDDDEEEDDDGDDDAERKNPDKDSGEPLEEVTAVPNWSAARRQTRAEGHQILVLPPEQIKQHGPNYCQLALGGLAVPSSYVQRSASFIAANRRPTSTIRGPLAPAPIAAAAAAASAGAAPPVVSIVVDRELSQAVASGDDDVSAGVRGEQDEGEELLVGAYTIATLRQKWAETASDPLLAESSGSGSGTPREDPTTSAAQADGDRHGEPSARTEKRKRKEKKKKGRKAYSSRRLYVDVLLVEATELSFPGKALQGIYGAKSLGDPYARLSLVRSLGAAPIGNVDDHCYPYCTRTVKKESDHPVWLDGVTFAYERLSVAKLWDQIQPRGERQDPAQREEWNAAKAQFVKRWKKMQKGDRTPAQQAFFDMCRAKLEPNLEVEVYFTMGGRRDGLVGSVSVPLCDLQDGLIHDLWLNLRPNAKWAQQLGMWGSVHLVIQKSKKPHLGMLSMHGPPVSPLPLRMEVGDIILFDSSRLLMQGTKLATRSPWDHAALVVKKRNKPGLRLFEATMDGVQVFNLTRRLQFYVKDTKIALRRHEMMEALYEFIEQVKGRPYKKNPFQLIKALAKFNAHDHQGSIFCSQLVAAAYQMMGLLSMDEPANNYLPVDLASLKLLKGSLGDLMVVPRLQKPKPRKKQPRHH